LNRIVPFMKKLIALLFFLSAAHTLNAQDQQLIDSLNLELSRTGHDTLKVDLMNEIGRAYLSSNPDSSLVIALHAKNLAVEKNYVPGKANSLRVMGIAFDNKGEFEKAIEYFAEAQKLFIQVNDASGIAKCFNDIGIILYEQAKYDSALHYLFIARNMQDSLHENLASVFNNISLIYYDLGDFDKCFEYIYKTLDIDEKNNDRQGLADSYLNIGSLYAQRRENDKARNALLKSMTYQVEVGDKQGMVSTYRELGKLFSN
jgi:tetratricopeptide (TPR) repeat protein